jgi:hypothetical protein
VIVIKKLKKLSKMIQIFLLLRLHDNQNSDVKT